MNSRPSTDQQRPVPVGPQQWTRLATVLILLLSAPALTAQDPKTSQEPFDRGLLPKIETGAARLLEVLLGECDALAAAVEDAVEATLR